MTPVKEQKKMPVWMKGAMYFDCNHGCEMEFDPENRLSTFMDSFYEVKCSISGTEDVSSIVDAISATFKKHPEVWNDDTLEKEAAVNVFLRIGTNSILIKEEFIDVAAEVAGAILMLEGSTCPQLGIGSIRTVEAAKLRDLRHGMLLFEG